MTKLFVRKYSKKLFETLNATFQLKNNRLKKFMSEEKGIIIQFYSTNICFSN